MRTFHIGGAAQRGAEQSSIEAPFDGKVKLDNASLIQTEDGSEVVMSRSSEMTILDSQGREKARYRLQYGAKLLKKEGESIKGGDVLAEWDPYTLPVIAETSGIVNYMDLMEGSSLTETLDDATGLSSKSVTDWKSSSKNSELKPRITLRDDKGEIIKKADGNEARYYLVPDTILSLIHISEPTRPS